MHRRNFLSLTGSSIALAPFSQLIASNSLSLQEDIDDFILDLVKENDRIIPILLKRQNQDPNLYGYGGMPNQYEIGTPGGTAGFLQRLAASYSTKSSSYYQDSNLIPKMRMAVDYLNKVQYDDGTIDLYSTNFHSTPDTGFVVEPLCLAYTLLQSTKNKELTAILTLMKRFLTKAGGALSVGGIHTPNHRWVVSMALSRIHSLFPNPEYIARVEEWLNEKIDIDPDGQYTEKSTNIYSPLTNRCLITIARILKKEELMEPVRRNLEMTIYYIHPNGEVATEASGRQDKYQTGTLLNYYYSYRYLAIKQNNARFANVEKYIRSTITKSQLSRFLPYFLEDKFLQKSLPSPEKLPDRYRKHFPHSKLLRIRLEKMDATILADNPTFFTFQKGEAVLQGLRIASAFFGKGQFVAERIEMDKDRIILHQNLEAPYYQPYPKDELPDDGDWEKMPRSKRPQSEIQKLTTRIEMDQVGQAFNIRVYIEGTRNVPVAIELGFRSGGTLSGVRTVNGIDKAYLLEGSEGLYRYGKDEIRFTSGYRGHTWTQLRGALPKLNADCVYITGMAPWRFEMRIG